MNASNLLEITILTLYQLRLYGLSSLLILTHTHSQSLCSLLLLTLRPNYTITQLSRHYYSLGKPASSPYSNESLASKVEARVCSLGKSQQLMRRGGMYEGQAEVSEDILSSHPMIFQEGIASPNSYRVGGQATVEARCRQVECGEVRSSMGRSQGNLGIHIKLSHQNLMGFRSAKGFSHPSYSNYLYRGYQVCMQSSQQHQLRARVLPKLYFQRAFQGSSPPSTKYYRFELSQHDEG